MASPMPTIVLAEDHALMASKISDLLRSRYNLVATVADGVAALGAVTTRQPDLVLLDVAMPSMSGVEAARQIQKKGLPTRIVFLSADISPEFLELASSLNASFVLKNLLHSDLLKAVQETLAGRTFNSKVPETKHLS